MTYYGIYKITNLLNGKMYIGQHTTSNIDDGYMGSGKIILRALKKYGKDNFRKEWLMFCEDEEELNYMERVYVDQTWVDRSDTYNLNLGGDYQRMSNQTRKKLSDSHKGKTFSEEHKRKLSESHKGISHIGYMLGHHHSEEARRKMSKSHKGKLRSEEHKRKLSESLKGNKNGKGYHHSEEARRKISEAAKIREAKKKQFKSKRK